MAQPTPYAPAFSFSSFKASNPASALPADKIDIELGALKTTLDQILANLARIQRDDTALANESVSFDQLAAEVKAGTGDGISALASAGLTFVSGVMRHTRSGAPGTFSTISTLFSATNTGASGGYGNRINYTQSGTHTSGFSIGEGIIATFPGTNGGQGLASWLVASTPTGNTANYGVYGQEVNPVNLGPDMGYSKRRGLLARWTGGIQVVPESQDLVNGGGFIGNHCTYAFAVTPSGSNNTATGDKTKSYNGFLVEQDAIAPGGRGTLLSGDTSGIGGRRPSFAAEIDQNWTTGVYAVDATFASGLFAHLKAGDGVGWGALGSKIDFDASDVFYVRAKNLVSFRVESVANQVNYVQTYGAATGGGPTIKAIGSDANINLNLAGTGTSGVRLKSGDDVNRVAVNNTGVGFNGNAPIARPTLAAAATDLASVITLANGMRTQLIAYGLAS